GGMPMTPRWLLWPFLVLLAAIISASAQDWPSKTVTVVVAAAAAGRSRGAGEQDGAHRLGGDAVREGLPAQGYGPFVAGTGAGACVSLGHRSRSSDEASVRGLHQGQQSIWTA